MHFQPLSPSPFPRKQGKGSDLPLPAGGEGPQGGVNAPHMALRASRCAERVESITRSSLAGGRGQGIGAFWRLPNNLLVAPVLRARLSLGEWLCYNAASAEHNGVCTP